MGLQLEVHRRRKAKCRAKITPKYLPDGNDEGRFVPQPERFAQNKARKNDRNPAKHWDGIARYLVRGDFQIEAGREIDP